MEADLTDDMETDLTISVFIIVSNRQVTSTGFSLTK